jgi:hypothetical protein
MEITSESSTQMIIVSKPMYIMGIFGLVLLLLAWAIRQDPNIAVEVIVLIGAAASLGPFLIRSTLTADIP